MFSLTIFHAAHKKPGQYHALVSFKIFSPFFFFFFVHLDNKGIKQHFLVLHRVFQTIKSTGTHHLFSASYIFSPIILQVHKK